MCSENKQLKDPFGQLALGVSPLLVERMGTLE